ADGLAFWVGLLDAGASHLQVAQGVYQSVEHRGRQVDQCYAAYLHRAPDAPGRVAWVQAFLNGADETAVAVGFLTSDEYRRSHADTAALLDGLYGDILGRAPDPVGLAAWPLVEADRGRAAVANGILTSVEGDLRLVDGYYGAYLGRPADDVGRQDWLTRLQMGVIAPAGL